MSKDIIFFTNHLTERGTEVALYDYAFYCNDLLKMNSYVVYLKYNQLNKDSIIKKFKNTFDDSLLEINSFNDLGAFTEKFKNPYLYHINDGRYFNYPSNVIPLQHSAFRNKPQRNSRFAFVSNWLCNFSKKRYQYWLLQIAVQFKHFRI